MNKNWLIMGAIGGAVFLFLASRKATAAAAATGATVYTTDGRTYTLKEGRDGFIYDQLGGGWA